MKLTKKYFREKINNTYGSACTVIIEAIKRYGDKCGHRGHREVKVDVSNERNGHITGFYYNGKCLLASVYWQGAHTDGNDYVTFDRDGIILPSEIDYDGSITRIIHNDIKFNSDQLYTAMKLFAENYLK